MLHIRLTRIGKKKQPEYRLMVCEKSRDPWGKALEILGHYNPRTNPRTISLKTDRITYWISVGAQCSNTVWNLLVDEGAVKGEKRKSIKLSKKRREEIAKNNKVKEVAKAEAAKKKEEVKEEPKEEVKTEPEAEEKAKETTE
jgi:small subunit ribosomal protein S16